MRDTIKGAILGAFVAAGVSVLLAQTTPSWTSPRTWATDDLLTASQFNAQIRDNLLNMRGFAACAENGTTGTSSALTVLYGDCRWDAAAAVTIAELGCTGTRSADTVLYGDCRWAEIPTQYVTALDQGTTSTTSSTYVDAGAALTFGVQSGSINLYVTGRFFVLHGPNVGSVARMSIPRPEHDDEHHGERGEFNHLNSGPTLGLLLMTDTAPSYHRRQRLSVPDARWLLPFKNLPLVAHFNIPLV